MPMSRSRRSFTTSAASMIEKSIQNLASSKSSAVVPKRGRSPQTVADVPLPNSAYEEGAPLTVSVRSEEHTSELQSLMRISYAVFCLKKKRNTTHSHTHE